VDPLHFILRATFFQENELRIDHAASIPHNTRQHNDSNNRHPGYEKEDKFVLKEQLTEMNLVNNRIIRREDTRSTTTTDTKLNTT
jgi:hypothetical protein